MSAIDNAGHPRIAWWLPWPPARSGIAEYSVSLLESLRLSANTQVFVADAIAARSRRLLADVAVLSASAFLSEHARQPFDAAVFHLGNQAGQSCSFTSVAIPIKHHKRSLGTCHANWRNWQ